MLAKCNKEKYSEYMQHFMHEKDNFRWMYNDIIKNRFIVLLVGIKV